MLYYNRNERLMIRNWNRISQKISLFIRNTIIIHFSLFLQFLHLCSLIYTKLFLIMAKFFRLFTAPTTHCKKFPSRKKLGNCSWFIRQWISLDTQTYSYKTWRNHTRNTDHNTSYVLCIYIFSPCQTAKKIFSLSAITRKQNTRYHPVLQRQE